MDEIFKKLKAEKSKEALDNLEEYIFNHVEEIPLLKPLLIEDIIIFCLNTTTISIETQIKILNLFLSLFFQQKFPNESLSTISFDKILKNSSGIYKQITFENLLFSYFHSEFEYPKLEDLKKGDIVDGLFESEDKYIWSPCEIHSINNETKKMICHFLHQHKIQSFEIENDFRVIKEGTFVKKEEEDWRKGLKVDSEVDALDSGYNWMPAIVTKREEDNVLISFKKSVGFDEKFDYLCSVYDSRIRRRGEYSFNLKLEESFLKAPCNNRNFNEINMMIPFLKEKEIICIPRKFEVNEKKEKTDPKRYSLEYIKICDYFMKNFAAFLQADEKEISQLSIDYFLVLIDILYNVYQNIYIKYSRIFIREVYSKLFTPILLSFSLDSKKNNKKVLIDSVFKKMKEIMSSAYYEFEIDSYLGVFQITFGVNCLKNTDNLEKRLLGLGQISESLKESIIWPGNTEKIMAVTTSLLTADPKGQDFFDIIFNGHNHSEVLKKSAEIISQLFKLCLISSVEMTKLYNYIITNNDIEVKGVLYKIFETNAKEMSFDRLEFLLKKIITLNQCQLTNDDINLLVSVAQSVPQDKYKSNADDILNYLYTYIKSKIIKDYDENIKLSKGKDLLNKFCSVINNAKIITRNPGEKDDFSNVIALYMTYINKIISEMYDEKEGNKIYCFIFLLERIIECIPKECEDDLRYKIRFHLLNENNGEKKLNDQILQYFSSDDQDKFHPEIFRMLNKIFEFINEFYFISSSNIIEYFKIFVFNKKKIKFLHQFIEWMTVMTKEDNPNIEPALDSLFEELIRFSDSNTENIIDSELIDYFYTLFKISNSKPNKYNEHEQNPLKFKHFDQIWHVLIKHSFREIVESFVSLFALPEAQPKERFKIWQDLCSQTFTTLESCNDNVIEIKSCLDILQLIISFSEYYGTAGVVSHSLILARENTSIMKIKVTNNLFGYKGKEEFELEIPKKASMYDLRKRISEKIKAPISVFSVQRFSISIPFKSNGISVDSQLSLSNNEITIVPNKDFLNEIPKKELVSKVTGVMTPRSEEVFREIFRRYSKDGKMSRNDMVPFLADSINTTTAITKDDNNITSVFSNYDRDKDGFITENDFIDFYTDCVTKMNKINLVWDNLRNLGYRNDLQKLDSPLEKEIFENDVKEYMPRCFVGQNINYLNKLMDLQATYGSVDIDIAEQSISIIDMLETNKEIFEQILNNQRGLKDCKNDSEMLYSLQIIRSIIQKDSEKWTKDFVEKGQFENLIQIFVTKSLSETSKKIDIMLYYLMLSIIKNTLIFMIGNPNVKETFKDICFIEDNEKKLKILEKDLSYPKGVFNSISSHFSDIVKTIHSSYKYLISFEKFIHQKRESISLSNSILILIMLSEECSPEIKKMYIDFSIEAIGYTFQFSQNYISLSNFIIIHKNKYDKEFINDYGKKVFKELTDGNCIIEINPSKNLFNIFQEILSEVDDSEKKAFYDEVFETFTQKLLKEKLGEEYVAGYFTIITFILEEKKEFDTNPHNELFSYIVDNYFINDPKEELSESKSFCNIHFIQCLFNILGTMIKSKENLETFLSSKKIINISEYTCPLEKKPTSSLGLQNKVEKVRFVGLVNLASICYMNSVLQQFYMVPAFKNSILKVETKDSDTDNVFYQLQRMFSFLKYSSRKAFSPVDFVHSFKDYSGNPTNPKDQCDAQEFLSRFMEKIEENLKNTEYAYLLKDIFGGETISKLLCTNEDCGKVSLRNENILYLSLDIKGCNNLYKCFDKFVAEESIEDFLCEKCKKKITHKRNLMLSKLPNILILHLKRITFNYETFLMEKLNSRLEFEKEISLKNYYYEPDKEDLEDEDFKYHLIGIVVHSGTAQFGHYYSLREFNKKWVKFNDAVVNEYQEHLLSQDCFGGIAKSEWTDRDQSAYMLVYEKRKKSLILLKNIETNKDEKVEEVESEKDLEQEMVDKTIFLKSLNDKVTVIQYNQLNKIDTFPDYFKREVVEDNIKFCNEQRIYSSSFGDYLIKVNNSLKNSIDKFKDEEIKKYFELLNTIVFTISFKMYDKDKLKEIVTSLMEVVKEKQELLLPYIFKVFLNQNYESIIQNLFTQDFTLGSATTEYLVSTVNLGVNGTVKENQEDAYVLVDKFMAYFPVDLSKKWAVMKFFLLFFEKLIKSNENIIKYLLSKDAITKFVDFILGRESPYYNRDGRTELGSKSISPKAVSLISSILELYKYANKNNIKLSEDTQKLISSTKFGIKVMKYTEGENLMQNLKTENGELISNYAMNDEDYLEQILFSFNSTILPFIKSAQICAEKFNVIKHILTKTPDKFINKKILYIVGIPQYINTKSNISFRYVPPNDITATSLFDQVIKKFDDSLDLVYIGKMIMEILLCNKYIFDYLQNLPSSNSFKYNYLIQLHKAVSLIIKKINKKERISFRCESESSHEEAASEYIKLFEQLKEKYNFSDTSEEYSIDEPSYIKFIKEEEFPLSYQTNNKKLETKLTLSKIVVEYQEDNKTGYYTRLSLHSQFKSSLHLSVKIPKYLIDSMVEIKDEVIDLIAENSKDIEDIDVTIIVDKIEEEKEEGESINPSSISTCDDLPTLKCENCSKINTLVLNDEYKCKFCGALLF